MPFKCIASTTLVTNVWMLFQVLSEQNAAHQQEVDALQKELEVQQAAAQAAQDKLKEQVAALTEQCNRYRGSTLQRSCGVFCCSFHYKQRDMSTSHSKAKRYDNMTDNKGRTISCQMSLSVLYQGFKLAKDCSGSEWNLLSPAQSASVSGCCRMLNDET